MFIFFSFYLAFWSYQAIGENFYLKPDKIRGLTSTSYNFSSNIFWGVVVFTLVIGIVKYFQSTSKSLELEKIQSITLFSGSILVIVGYLSSAFPQ